MHLMILLRGMTLKLKSTKNEHIEYVKNLEGYGKNWMHFVYKMDNLFRSIRVSNENSSVTKGFHFFKHILTQDFSTFNMHHSKLHHYFSTLFWLHLLFFMHFLIYFELRWPWNWKALQMKSEMVENWHGIIISPM